MVGNQCISIYFANFTLDFYFWSYDVTNTKTKNKYVNIVLLTYLDQFICIQKLNGAYYRQISFDHFAKRISLTKKKPRKNIARGHYCAYS